MPDPITMTIATAIASQTAQTLTARATSALAEIVRRITRKFRDQPADLAALADAQDHPDSAERVSSLAEALHRAILGDPVFAQEITALWTQSRVEITTATSDGVVNTFHGNADKVIQFRDLHGDLTIN
ncbi:MAG: hypothetical protein ACRDOI_44895 [Trebonia sp.]